MRQTEHYQLNQWDAEDRILREDFNRDNGKVDEALNGLAQEVGKKANTDTMRAENLWVKLGETTLNSAAGQLELTAAGAEN